MRFTKIEKPRQPKTQVAVSHGAADIAVANNVIVRWNQAATIGGVIENPTRKENVIWNTNGGRLRGYCITSPGRQNGPFSSVFIGTLQRCSTQ